MGIETENTTTKDHGPWPERISVGREIMWMVVSVALGLLVIPALVAVPIAWLLNSESAFIWLLIAGSIVGGIIAFRFYKGTLRKRALAAGRFIEYSDGNLVLPDANGHPETWPVTGASAGWFTRHGGSTSGTMHFLWLLVESPRGRVLLITDGETLQGDWIRGLEKVEPDHKTIPEVRNVRMFGRDLGNLIRLFRSR